MQVIHIFGASGAGTSTLGKTICARTGFRFRDSDDYIWQPTDPPFTALRSGPERRALLEKDLDECGDAVVSGSLVGWGDPLMAGFTLAVRLVTPTDVRLDRIKRREYERFGDRILPGGDMYEQHQAFLAWAARYDDGAPTMRSRAMHDLWQKQLPCPLLILDSTLPVEELVETVIEKL